MGRKSIAKIRRAELAMAAYETLTEFGIKGTTLIRVAEKAGVSKAGILHYYSNKEELLEAALRQANTVVRNEVSALFRLANTPWERVYAVIEGNFSQTSFMPEVAHSWINLCAEVPYNSQFQRIQSVIYRRMNSNLYSALKEITDPMTAQKITQTLTTAIDGLWLRCGLQLGGVDQRSALDELEFLLAALMPNNAARHVARDRMHEVQLILTNASKN